MENEDVIGAAPTGDATYISGLRVPYTIDEMKQSTPSNVACSLWVWQRVLCEEIDYFTCSEWASSCLLPNLDDSV